MTIKKINKLINHRIFRDFNWPSDLHEFNEKNLIYGWNGSGKSTLSELFRSIEKRSPILDGEIEFAIAGDKIEGKNLDSIQVLPQIRVFNKDFLDDNVFTNHGALSPIFYLGEKNIEKQKLVEKLGNDLKQVERNLKEKQSGRKQSEKLLDEFIKEQAKTIKHILSSSGSRNQYNNYDKRTFQNKCEELIQLSEVQQSAKIVAGSDFEQLKKKLVTTHLEILKVPLFSYPDTQLLTDQVVVLLEKTIASAVIDALKSDQELSEWVKKGLSMHKKDKSDNCLFCEQPLPENRISELDAHFNDEYNAFLSEIEYQSKRLNKEIEFLEFDFSIHKNDLYEHLKSDFRDRLLDLTNETAKLKKYLESLQAAVIQKAQKPFQSIEANFSVVTGNTDLFNNFIAVIDQHNRETDEFQNMINETRVKIEESLVAKSLKDYLQKKCDLQSASDTLKLTSSEHAELERKIRIIESEIEEHRRPAEELSADICSYLGRDDLTIEVKDNGYEISRKGAPAKNLSESERTAIGFLYFLKSLSDNSFHLEDGIVVIDDPVSSLDSNSLFHAFGYMKDRTHNVGQLFILTHNHSFFRLVKNWFTHLPKQRKKDLSKRSGKFFMLTNKIKDGSRHAYISNLDSLLYDYESEYHYLFSLVYAMANTEGDNHDLQSYYHLPNIARRLLESYLAFRQPLKREGLRQKLEPIKFDLAKKNRIIRFLHTYSHSDQISDPDHDPSILHETQRVLQDLLCLIQQDDCRHFEQMKILASK